MSRRSTITADGVMVVIGYDPPTRSFFAQAFTDDQGEDWYLLDIGATPWDRITSLRELDSRMGVYATAVTEEMWAGVREDAA